MDNIVKKILISEEEISARVQELGQQISEDYRGRELLLIGILKGAAFFLSDLSRAINIPITIDFMSVQSYGSKSESTGEVRIIKDLDFSVQGKNVLIVEDIIDSGRTLAYLKRNLLNRGAESVRISAFLDKPDRREVDVHVDYIGKKIPNEFIVGYGLDFNEMGRNLPYIAALKDEIYRIKVE